MFGVWLELGKIPIVQKKSNQGEGYKTVRTGEELLMCYSKDGSYWAAIFSKEQLSQITAA